MTNPTFGCNPTATGSSVYYTSDKLVMLYATSPTDVATAQSISMKSGSYTGNFKGVITNSSGNIITNGVAAASSYGLGWNTSTFSTQPILSPSTNYFLSVITDSILEIKYDYSNIGLVDGTNSYSSPQNTGGNEDRGSSFLIYCTYVAASGAVRSKINGGLFTTGLINGGLIR